MVKELKHQIRKKDKGNHRGYVYIEKFSAFVF